MADVAGALGSVVAVGSALPGKQLCCRQLRGLKTLIVYLFPSKPRFSLRSLCREVCSQRDEGRRRQGGKEVRTEEPRGPGPTYHDQHRLSRLPPSLSIVWSRSPWQHSRLHRILTPQWGILQIKGDIFGVLPYWLMDTGGHFFRCHIFSPRMTVTGMGGRI